MTDQPPSSDSDSVFEEEVERFLGAAGELGLRADIEECWDCLWLLWRDASPCLDRDAIAYERARRGGEFPKPDGTLDCESLRDGVVELLTGRVFPSAAHPEAIRLADDLFSGLLAHYEKAGEDTKSAVSHALESLRDLARRPEQFSEIRSIAGLGEEPLLQDTNASQGVSTPPETTVPLIPGDLYLTPAEESDLQTEMSRKHRKDQSGGIIDHNTTEERENSVWFLRKLRFGEEDWTQSFP